MTKRTIRGFELNTTFYPIKNLHINVGGSYILKASETMEAMFSNVYYQEPHSATETDIIFLSKYTLNVMTSYKFLSKYTVGLNGFYFSDRLVPTNYQSNVPAANKNPDNANSFFKLAHQRICSII